MLGNSYVFAGIEQKCENFILVPFTEPNLRNFSAKKDTFFQTNPFRHTSRSHNSVITGRRTLKLVILESCVNFAQY